MSANVGLNVDMDAVVAVVVGDRTIVLRSVM